MALTTDVGMDAGSSESDDEGEVSLFQRELRRTEQLRRAAIAGGEGPAEAREHTVADPNHRKTEPLFAQQLRETEMFRRQQKQGASHHEQRQVQPPARQAPTAAAGGEATGSEEEAIAAGRMESLANHEEGSWVPAPAQAHSLGAAQRARRATARAAPVWVRSTDPVLRVCAASPHKAACQLCTAVFGYLTRKHHCRYCGWAVCGACSAHFLVLERWLLPYKPHAACATPSPTAQRVCDSCYFELGPVDSSDDCSKVCLGAPRTRAELLRRRQDGAEFHLKPCTTEIYLPLLGPPPASAAPRRRLAQQEGEDYCQFASPNSNGDDAQEQLALERGRMMAVSPLSASSFRPTPTSERVYNESASCNHA